jgi:hypothetical protein
MWQAFLYEGLIYVELPGQSMEQGEWASWA